MAKKIIGQISKSYKGVRKYIEEEKKKRELEKLKAEKREKEKERKETAKTEAKLQKILSKNSIWEYKVVQVKTLISGIAATGSKIPEVKELDKLGTEGWELVSVFGLQAIGAGLGVHSQGTTTNVAFIFKRKRVD